ncbi:MAG TPA: hypothetical protein VIT22_09945 [Pseudoxanthomonas sp.]
MATDAPVIATVHNTRDNGWLTYECSPVEDERLACTMTQVSVRKKLKPLEVELKYQSAIKRLEAEKNDPEMKELCTLSGGMLALLQGGSGKGLPPDFDVPALKEMFKGLNTMQRRDMEQQYSAAMETCRTKNMDGMRRMIRLGIEKDTRTCLVSTNRFEQTYRPILGSDGKLLSWTVADTTPQGDCGFVQMSRFIPEPTQHGRMTLLWKYIAKRATSNPEGENLLGSCKEWEEVETVYDWQDKEIPLQCDYIEHSIF